MHHLHVCPSKHRTLTYVHFSVTYTFFKKQPKNAYIFKWMRNVLSVFYEINESIRSYCIENSRINSLNVSISILLICAICMCVFVCKLANWLKSFISHAHCLLANSSRSLLLCGCWIEFLSLSLHFFLVDLLLIFPPFSLSLCVQ